MHAAARLTSQAKDARSAARKLAAFHEQLQALAARASTGGTLGAEMSPTTAPEGTLML
jgi:hypothetical protein